MMRTTSLGVLTALACCMSPLVSRTIGAQSAPPLSINEAEARRDSSSASQETHRVASRAVPSRRWIPRHVSLGVGGVATSSPGGGTTYAPSVGGAFDIAAIGYVNATIAWRVEGFVHLHDRSVTSEAGLLNASRDASGDACAVGACEPAPRETARRTTGVGLGVEYHPMRGRVGVYTIAMLGAAGTNSFGDAGRCLGFAPSAGIGVLAPLSAGLDGFAVEARWRRVPTPIGAVNAGGLSFVLRF